MKIGLVGAFDRNNFGDLLMPIVFEKQYKLNNPNKDVEFEYYGQAKRNMKILKSYDTEELSKCYNNCDIVIIVGGEVLSATYKLMYLNLQSNKLKIFMIRCLNKIFPSFIEKMAKKRLKGKENKPWVLDKDKLNCKKLIYNTIGGNIKKNQEDVKCLNNVDYISMRSKTDFENMIKINDNAKLFPDSVTTISKIFTEEEIYSNVGNDIKELTKEKYFIIQTDYRNNKNSIKEIGNQINSICKKNDINCILLPIGYAQGHEDQKALAKIKKYCNNNKVLMPRMTNIYETIYILKKAQVFIGTSLHGIIVSTSYGVPHMVLTNKIPKLLNYVDTWESTSVKYTDIDDILNNFEKVYNHNEKQRILESKERIIELALENFKNIDSIINEVAINE